MRKIFFGSLSLLGVLAILPLFAAFEAHVINVTATIENALAVTAAALDFGTVFPQEHLARQLDIALSGSFLAEPRVDDVSYFIRQKPKCAVTSNDGVVLLDFPTATGEVIVNQENSTSNSITRIDCGPAPAGMPQEGGAKWGVLPSLCEYISKTGEEIELGDVGDGKDGVLLSFHRPWRVENGQLVWNDTSGYLAKSSRDFSDIWTIDLAVPCFGGACAQDWEDFVRRTNSDALPAGQWVQPAGNEHKVFGCDLWVEVSGVSLADDEPPPAEPVTLFSDDFGAGANSAEIPSWEKHEAGTILKAPAASGEDTASPDGGRFVRIAEDSSDEGTEDGWICRPIDAAGYHSLNLSYYWRGDEDTEGGETGLVEYFTGGTCPAPTGGPNNLAVHDLTASASWTASAITLPAALDGATFLLRFYNNSSADDENFRVDDVVMTGTAI